MLGVNSDETHTFIYFYLHSFIQFIINSVNIYWALALL